MDVRYRVAICYALPYDVYHLVESCISAKVIITTLIVTYEGTDEVRNNKNTLIYKYEYFFSYKNDPLTSTFIHFKCLINDLRKFDTIKNNDVLVDEFLDSLDESWEHYDDIL